MNRLSVLNEALRGRRHAVYLEIGVKRGNTFLRVRATRKLAVDPEPLLGRRRILASILRDPRNAYNRYFRMRSDDFFSQEPAILSQNSVDVAFVDGLHTYEQSLRDVYHCLEVIKPDGVIVLHDCNPQSRAAATPLHDIAGGNPGLLPGWSGDVWKTVLHLRATEHSLLTAVLDCDCGLGIIRKEKEQEPLPVSLADIMAMEYDDLEADRHRLLDLRDPAALPALLGTSQG